MQVPKRSGRPREAERHEETGGENCIPRSFGLTLEAVRDELGWDQAKLMNMFKYEIESRYTIRDYRTADSGKLDTVSKWESAQHEPPFGVQHRYGLASGTWSGVLHVISLIYADLRDATDAVEREDKLREILALADGLSSLANCARNMVRSYAASELKDQLAGRITDSEVRERHKLVVRSLLAAYRPK